MCIQLIVIRRDFFRQKGTANRETSLNRTNLCLFSVQHIQLLATEKNVSDVTTVFLFYEHGL